MLRLLGCHTEVIPTLDELLSRLPAQWIAAWKAGHSLKNGDVARQSLAGLALLARSGASGELRYGKRGRPALNGAPDIDFSITHTKGLVLCAVASGDAPRVGADAETIGRIASFPIEQLCARWFTDAERAEFQAAPTAEQFARIWTRKEALVKYFGTGLSDLRGADTSAATTLGLGFAEYRAGDVLITLCHRADEIPPTKIELC